MIKKTIFLLFIFLLFSITTRSQTSFDFYYNSKDAIDNLVFSTPLLPKTIYSFWTSPLSIANNKKAISFSTLFFLDQKSYSFNYSSYINRRLYLGLGMFVIDYGSFEQTTIEAPYGTGNSFKAYDILFKSSISYKLQNNILFSYSTNVFYSSYYLYNSYGISNDFNIRYIFTPNQKIELYIRNLGYQLKPYIENKYPLLSQIGISLINSLYKSWNFLVNFHLKFPLEKDNNITSYFHFINFWYVDRNILLITGVEIPKEYIFKEIFNDYNLYSLGLNFNMRKLGFSLSLKTNSIFNISYAIQLNKYLR